MIELLFYVFITASNGNVPQQAIISPLPAVQQVVEVKKKDPRIERLKVFFNDFDSPLAGLSTTFIKAADKNKLDWKLLPVVACVESSCGKYYKYNVFGWGSSE